jgi:hypothetical protein
MPIKMLHQKRYFALKKRDCPIYELPQYPYARDGHFCAAQLYIYYNLNLTTCKNMLLTYLSVAYVIFGRYRSWWVEASVCAVDDAITSHLSSSMDVQ